MIYNKARFALRTARKGILLLKDMQKKKKNMKYKKKYI